MWCLRGLLAAALGVTICACGNSGEPPSQTIHPLLTTAAVADDADDPAFWIDSARPAQSLIIGTNKEASPSGALYVFGLDGAVKQIVKPLDRPNNVDVEYGLQTPSGPVDIAVATERFGHRLRVYRVDANGLVAIDGGGVPVLEGESGERAMPMGVSLYRRARDGAVFAIVAPKEGGATGHLWQYRLTFDAASGTVRGSRVRQFGNFSGTGETEAVAVDDALGYVYYADEEFGIRKWHADPEHADAGQELAVFGTKGFQLQREGIAVVGRADGTGYIICADQVPGGSRLLVFPREGHPGRPHDHDPALRVVATEADSTDGLDATSAALDARFRGGLLAMMHSRGRQFQLYALDDLLSAVGAPPLSARR